MVDYIVPMIKTSRLTLRELKKTDSKEIFDIFSDREVTRYYDVSTMRKLVTAEKLLVWWEKRIIEKKALRWGITVTSESEKIVGTCGFSELDLKNKIGELGIDIVHHHWNQGIMKEALQAIIDYGFNDLKLNRIETWIMDENIYSILGAKSLGLKYEGKSGKIKWQGKYHDKEIFALNRQDYYQK